MQWQRSLSDVTASFFRGLKVMDPVEELLAACEEDLSMSELERGVVLLSDVVQSRCEQLEQARAELQSLEAETHERSQIRESYVSLLAKTLDLQEALEEEEKTQQELRELKEEMERLSNAPQLDSREVLESRLKQVEDIMAVYQTKEREVLEETESLRELLKRSQEKLALTSSEHQIATEDLDTLQKTLPDRRSVTDRLLDSCITEMGLLTVLPNKKHHKK